MPTFHLLLASGIVSTGMESSKVLRLFNALKIPNIKQRELSNLLKFYVIPAVYQVWHREQLSRLNEIRGKAITIASDMRVDSPGHSGLFGSGSTLELDRNIVRDTQIIKVNKLMGENNKFLLQQKSRKVTIITLTKNEYNCYLLSMIISFARFSSNRKLCVQIQMQHQFQICCNCS